MFDSRPSPLFYIRMARPEDVEACRAIDVELWGDEAAATAEMLQSRIATYPFGNFVAVRRQDEAIIGSVWTVAVPYDKLIATWWDASGEGCYSGVCDPHGDKVMGVNLSARPSEVESVGRALVTRAGEAAWIAGKRQAVLGSRIPGYHRWSHVLRAEDYARLLRGDGAKVYFRNPATQAIHEGPLFRALQLHRDGLIDPRSWPVASLTPARLAVFDAELGMFMSISVGGCPCRIYGIMPGYFPDPPSLDNGVLIGWENPERS